MSVYVDDMMVCIPNRNWRYPESAHLFADTNEELHAFAAKLGLRRAWFQDNPRLPHYDLTRNKRHAAILNHAIPLDRHASVAKWDEIRARAAKGLTSNRATVGR